MLEMSALCWDKVLSSGWSALGLPTGYADVVMIAIWSPTCPVASTDSSIMTNYMSVTPTLGSVYGSLIDGARAWRHFIARFTGARFCMPHRTPTLLTSLSIC